MGNSKPGVETIKGQPGAAREGSLRPGLASNGPGTSLRFDPVSELNESDDAWACPPGEGVRRAKPPAVHLLIRIWGPYRTKMPPDPPKPVIRPVFLLLARKTYCYFRATGDREYYHFPGFGAPFQIVWASGAHRDSLRFRPPETPRNESRIP